MTAASPADWHWDPDRLRADLAALGYDVDGGDASLPGGGSLSARRERGTRSHLVAVDAGGRFRATTAVAAEEDGRAETVAGVPVRLVAETRRSWTVSATLTDPAQLAAVVAGLDRLAPPPEHDGGVARGDADQGPAPGGPGPVAAFALAGEAAARERAGEAYRQFLDAGSLSVGLYALSVGGEDAQRPHVEDEVYYALAGRATLRAGDRDHPVVPGAVLFVAAGVEHRFRDITEDLLLLVLFAPEHAPGA